MDMNKVLELGTQPGVVIRHAREQRGMTQGELAKKIGVKQQTIEKIENGKIKNSKHFPMIAMELNVALPTLIPSLKNAGVIPGNQLVGDRDLPVHAAAEGGRGALIVSTDPVDWVARPGPLLRVKDGYGILISEESMVPEFEPGDVALVHPHLPPIAGSTCVFYKREEDGTSYALIKRLVRITGELWHVRQHNPKKDLTLKRIDWQICHVTVGRYNGR